MHELSIVDALIEQVRSEVDRSGHSGRVTRLELAIGRLSGVNADSVRFAFQMLSPGTLLESAALGITEPRAVSRCADCGDRVEIDELAARCPNCGSCNVVIEGGQELLLQTIELEDGPPTR
jgi:hydrogenase nickel incorporation protein HypA/HybF